MAKRTFKTSGGRAVVPVTRGGDDEAKERAALGRLARKGGEVEIRVEFDDGRIRVLGDLDADDLDDYLDDPDDLWDYLDGWADENAYGGAEVVGIVAVSS